MHQAQRTWIEGSSAWVCQEIEHDEWEKQTPDEPDEHPLTQWSKPSDGYEHGFAGIEKAFDHLITQNHLESL